MPQLQSNWFKNVSAADKAEVEQIIRNSTITLRQLTLAIEAEIREKESLTVGDYDNPNWPYRQADKNGALRVLKNLLKMTKLEEPNYG